MATVTYECNKCGHVWYKGPGKECPECECTSIITDWDERRDFEQPEEDDDDDS